MLAALPIASVQTPPPLTKNRRRASSPSFTEGRGGLHTAYPSHPFTYFLISGQLLRTPDISNFLPGRLD